MQSPDLMVHTKGMLQQEESALEQPKVGPAAVSKPAERSTLHCHTLSQADPAHTGVGEHHPDDDVGLGLVSSLILQRGAAWHNSSPQCCPGTP